MENKNQTIDELIQEETENRLAEMASPDYEFPKKITKNDVIAMIALAVGSLVLIGLCMIGVIK